MEHDPFLIIQLLLAAFRVYEERAFLLDELVLDAPVQSIVFPGITITVKIIWEHVFKNYLYYYLRVEGVPASKPADVTSVLGPELVDESIAFIVNFFSQDALFFFISDCFEPALTDDKEDLRPYIRGLMNTNPMLIVHLLVTCAKLYCRYIVDSPRRSPSPDAGPAALSRMLPIPNPP